jgi:hypothetical protein
VEGAQFRGQGVEVCVLVNLMQASWSIFTVCFVPGNGYRVFWDWLLARIQELFLLLRSVPSRSQNWPGRKAATTAVKTM